jgi:imidazolonepropionase-like amidohydrolase
VGATLVDVRNGKEIENSVLVIRGERIIEVGVSGKIQAPTDARIVDAHGRWIIPGLIDMHVHLWDADLLPLSLFLANGITTIRDPGDSVLIMRLTQDEITSGKRISPRLFFCGDLLDGIPPLYRESTLLVDTPERAHSAVMFLADQGVNCIKVYNSIKEPELKEIIRTAHERGLPVIGHVPRTLTMTQAVEMGMDGLEHIRVTGREMLPMEEANKIDFLPFAERETRLWQRFEPQSEKMRRLAQFLSSSKVVLDPTVAADENVFVLSPDDQINDSRNHYLPQQLLDKWKAEPLPEFARLPPDLKQAATNGYEKRKQFVGMCNRAGVRIIAGTDGAGLGTMLPGFGLQHELQLLVQSGLTPLQAIQAATINAAAALKKEHDLGVVEPGYFADIVILNADPLKDISNTQKLDLVIYAGKSYKPLELLPRAQAGSSAAMWLLTRKRLSEWNGDTSN